MNIIQLIEVVKSRIVTINDIEVKEEIKDIKSNVEELTELEIRIGIEFPTSLRELYLNYTNQISFSWSVEVDIFGRKCNSGRLNILSPKQIEMMYNDMKLVVDEVENNEDELKENEGLQAIVNDWLYWIPIIVFPNGDAFCIEKRNGCKTIVFLEHDVMDGGPNLHGLKIATSFEELMNKWSKVNFVDIFDWTLGVNHEGIDLSKTIFDKLLGRS